jgi:pyruvate dehydrogenase phosphatase
LYTRFLILASDGVWDFLSDQEAVEVVSQSVDAHGGSTEHAAADLVEATLSRAAELNNMTVGELKAIPAGSERRKRYDDTTAVVMFFEKHSN